MFVERQIITSKKGKYRELQDLLIQWSSEFPFPRATAERYYFTYAGQGFHAISIEREFSSLADLQLAWEEWEAAGDEMAAFLTAFEDLVDEQAGPEIWRVVHGKQPVKGA